MSRRSYTALDDKSATTNQPTARRARASRSSSTSNNSALILGLTTNIGELTKMNNKLERSLVRLGTVNDNPGFRQRIQDDQHDTTQLVKSTIESLAAAQPLLDGVQYKRLSLQFEQTYKKYTGLTKQIDDKQKQLISQSQSHSSNSSTSHNSHYPYSNHTTSDYDSNPYQQQQQQEQQYDDDVVFTEMEHEEIVKRVEEIKQIETEVSEVAQLYKDLHVLVNEQQSDIDTISENVAVVSVKVEEGHEQLVRAAGNPRSARNLKCWVAVIVCIVIGLAIVVMLVLKKTNIF